MLSDRSIRRTLAGSTSRQPAGRLVVGTRPKTIISREAESHSHSRPDFSAKSLAASAESNCATYACLQFLVGSWLVEFIV